MTEGIKLTASERVKRWRAAQDPDLLRAKRASEQRNWRKRNPASAKALDKHIRDVNADKIKARTKAWRSRNKDYLRSYDTEAKKKFRTEQPDRARQKGRLARQRRRSAELLAEGSFNSSDINALMHSQSATCVGILCGRSLSEGYEIDHVIPISRGGTNWPRNLQLLCPSCNSRKWSRTMDEWAATFEVA